MGVQSQMIMQNFNHNPNLLLHDQECSYHDGQFSNVTSSNSTVHEAGCNWFPFSSCNLTEMPSIRNCADPCQVDVDSYINYQCEKMRKMVHEQRRVELARLAKKFEIQTLFLMSQKDEQMKHQMLQIMELQQLSSMLQHENESLHSLAEQNHATIKSLKQTLLQLHDTNDNMVEDAESCCDEVDMTMRRDSTERLKPVICVGCDLREANMVFLPCRHLCSCEVCDIEMQECPFCKRNKSSSIMTLVF